MFTHQDLVLLSAATGYLLVDDFSEVQQYISDLLARPVFTHELGSVRVENDIHNAVKEDLLDLAKRIESTFHLNKQVIIFP